MEKKHAYRLIFHNSILTRKMKKMTSVANNFSIFSINRKKKQIHFRLTNFVRRYTRGRGKVRAGGGALVLGM